MCVLNGSSGARVATVCLFGHATGLESMLQEHLRLLFALEHLTEDYFKFGGTALRVSINNYFASVLFFQRARRAYNYTLRINDIFVIRTIGTGALAFVVKRVVTRKLKKQLRDPIGIRR